MSTLYTYLSRSWKKKPLIAGKNPWESEKKNRILGIINILLSFFYQDFFFRTEPLFIFHRMIEKWRFLIKILNRYIHISHLKSFQIPVEIQNSFYNISFIFTTLHFRKSFKFSQIYRENSPEPRLQTWC